MKKFFLKPAATALPLLAALLALFMAAPQARAATSVNLVNYSFETNTAGQTFSWKVYGGYNVAGSNDVAGWLDAGTTYVNSGVDYAGDAGNTAESGSVFAFCDSGDSGAYQISGYQMKSGDQITLTWWANGTWGTPGQVVTLWSAASTTSSFGSLTPLATSTAAVIKNGIGGAYTEYTLTYTAQAGDAGNYVGVSFKASGSAAGSWTAFDNFGLSVTTNAPGAVSASHSTLSPSLVSLTANGTNTQVITVQARDASNNNEQTGGATVVFSLTGSGTIGSTTDNGNGTYTVTLTAPSSSSTGAITATLNGTAVGTAVSASQSTATYFSSTAGNSVPNLSSALTTNFTVGGATFGTTYYAAQGLGPIYNNSSCANCHNFPVQGGSGTSLLKRFGLNTNGVFNPLTNLDGTLLHTAFINANCTETNVPSSANVIALRKTRMLFGAGLIEAIPASVITSNAAVPNVDGIVGTPAYVTDLVNGQQLIGRFGWKGQYATLLSFSADAENNELGRTSRIEPVGHAPFGNTSLYNTYNTLADPNDVTNGTGKADIDRNSDYIRLLAPAPTVPLTANAVTGRALFHSISCDECHTPSLTTTNNFIPVSDLASETSSPIAGLSGISVPLYSDLLLHNMGSLNDGIGQGGANTNQMLTAPLWGLRFKIPYLHDGRATNSVDTAIRLHDGDALPAATRYINLTTQQQQDIQAFLNSI
jgi:CxxC motif-containing protein (DUF1111 family)